MDGKKKGILDGISPNVLFLGLVSFLTDVSSEMINAVFPSFLKAIGAGGPLIGFISGLGESLVYIVMIFSGYESDKRGRRVPFVFAGYGMSSVSKFLFAVPFLQNPLTVAAIKAVERAGKGIRNAPRDAILSESKKEMRGRVFGIHRAMDSAGAVAGSVLAFVLVYFFAMHFNDIFIIAGIVGLTALVPLLKVRDVARAPRHNLRIASSLRALPSGFKTFLLISSVFTLGNFTYVFFILRAQDFYPQSDAALGFSVAVLLYAWYNIWYTNLSIPAGMLSDRIGRKKVLLASYLLFSITCIGFAFSQTVLPLVFFFAVYGAFMASLDATQKAFVADLSPPDLKGTAMGTFFTAIGFATLAGNLAAGYLWDMGAGYTFIYGAGAGLVSFALLFYASLSKRL